MTFADVFPMLTDEQVEEYQKQATKAERRELEGYLDVQRVINARPATHIVSTSLFWKNTKDVEPEIVIRGRSALMQRDKKDLIRFDPWEHYVAPLLRGAYVLAKQRPEVVMRVYLAADLEFLVPDLMLAGCEIYLMKTSSLAHNPGALWRYLAFEEKDKLITVVDADRAPQMLLDIDRTEGTAKLGLSWWRVPIWGELNRYGKMNYRPFLGCQLGGCTWLPMNLLMQAMIWHSKRGTMPHLATPPGCAKAEIAGHDWPNYGDDEWFLSAAVYPRAAMDGILTFVPSDAKCRAVMKADFFRVLAVYHLGGFYLDTDVWLSQNLEPLRASRAVFPWEHEFGQEEFGKRYPASIRENVKPPQVGNYAFGAEAGHPFLATLLEEMIRRTALFEVETCSEPDVLRATGPDMVTTVYYRNKNQWPDVQVLKGASYLPGPQPPLHANAPKHWQRFGNFGSHLLAGSWKK